MDSYFTNMTSFSLFRPGSIEPKFALMHHHSEAETLIAAMFSFSARFLSGGDGDDDAAKDVAGPSYFARVASTRLDRAVGECGDMTPSFLLLQAHILVAFYQLTQGVRARSWRTLGSCVLLAY